MTTEVVLAIATMVLAVILLSIWKAGRAIFIESLLHPFRSAILHIFEDGTTMIFRFADPKEDQDGPKQEGKKGVGFEEVSHHAR
jgi:hypothetical protein